MSLPGGFRNGTRRRGVTAVTVTASLVLLVGMASMTIDIGMMYRGRGEAQASADAAAMASAWHLMDQDRLRGSSYVDAVSSAARVTGDEFAGRNSIINKPPDLDLSVENSAGGDILLGRLENPDDPNEAMTFADPSRFNAVRVFLHRDEERNGPLELYFAGVFGDRLANVTASATAAFYDGVIGWRVTDETGNAGLLPFALRKTYWDQLLAGTYTTGDNYAYNPDTGHVSSGSDGILELNLYPGSGGGQLPPGNFGTVDIGSESNSSADIARQILYGVNADDLAHFGGTLVLGDDGTLLLNGDTGLSAGFKDELAAIIGQPRAIPVFTDVEGPGNNAMFTVVGFVGIRICAVKLTGPMSGKKVIIQPAYLLDDSAIVGENSGQSDFIYRPVQLIR